TENVIIRKGFRFRIYPTEQQVARIAGWESALRWLWNLALEQRLMGLRRTDKVYPTAFDQINELTPLRAELPWLADVPRNVCAQLLVELDKAWQRCFKKLARKPRWKRKGIDALGLCEPHPKAWRIEGANIRFPKLGGLRAVIHRPLEGRPKTCTIRRDGDQWFASILCEIDIADPAPRAEPIVAIDVGITHLLADSDGNLTPNPEHLKKALKRLAHAQRTVARRKRGSKNREKAKTRVMRLHRKVRRQREHTLHVESARLAKSHGTVIVEKLNVAGMIRGNLSRSIADAGWSRFKEMLRYKLAWSGGQLVEVPAAYSSQTCSACGHVDAASRRGEKFCCTACKHTDHADLNAAKVLKSRANRSALPVEASGLPGLRSRKVKRELRVPRRSPSQGSGL
ncbi:MAG: transposase, partial [Parcubacteria group bacterium]